MLFRRESFSDVQAWERFGTDEQFPALLGWGLLRLYFMSGYRYRAVLVVSSLQSRHGYPDAQVSCQHLEPDFCAALPCYCKGCRSQIAELH